MTMAKRITKYAIALGIMAAVAVSSSVIFILSAPSMGVNPCTLPFSTSSASAMMAPATKEELFKNADVVLVGEVKNRESKCEGTGIVTDYQVKVEQYLKNPLHDSILTVRTYGGDIRGYGIGIEDQPSFNIGDRVFLYLSKKDGLYYASAYSRTIP